MPSPSDMPSPLGGVFCFVEQIHPLMLAWLPFEVFSVLKFDEFKNRFQPDSLPWYHEVWCSHEQTPRSPAVSWINCLWIQTPNPNSWNPPFTSSTRFDYFVFWNSDSFRTESFVFVLFVNNEGLARSRSTLPFKPASRQPLRLSTSPNRLESVAPVLLNG